MAEKPVGCNSAAYCTEWCSGHPVRYGSRLTHPTWLVVMSGLFLLAGAYSFRWE